MLRNQFAVQPLSLCYLAKYCLQHKSEEIFLLRNDFVYCSTAVIGNCMLFQVSPGEGGGGGGEIQSQSHCL